MALTLPGAGFRFTYRTGEGWRWRQEVLPGDIDATDMAGPGFEETVKITENRACARPVTMPQRVNRERQT